MAQCFHCGYKGNVVNFQELSFDGRPVSTVSGKAVFNDDGSIGLTPIPSSTTITLIYLCPECEETVSVNDVLIE